MGDELVQSTLTQAPNVYSAVTRSDDGLQILLVNRSREKAAPVTLQSSEALSDTATAIQLSHREYFWNPHTHKPQWSRRPEPATIKISAGIHVPPFCALVLQVPFVGQASLYPESLCSTNTRSSKRETCPTNKQTLLLPKSTPEDVPVEAWILAPDIAPCSANTQPQFIELKVEGPATLSHEQVRINEGAGRFYITPTGTGMVTVVSGDACAHVISRPIQTRTEIIWPFEKEFEGIRSDYKFWLSDTAKPNQQTAAVRLDNTKPKPQYDTLLAFESIPKSIPKERVGGFSFEVRGSNNLATADPHAALQVILQSESDHWIPIGSIPLSELKKGWQTVEMKIQDHQHLDSMKRLYAIRIQLSSTHPVSGEIYINDAGLILR